MQPRRSPGSSAKPLTVTVEAQPGRPVYFISDVHLGYGSADSDAERERLLLALLHRLAADASHVFIVGDLFDAWFDYRQVIPRGHVRTLAALAGLREAGIPITYLMGNHDFAHFRYFREVLDIPIVSTDVEAVIGTTTMYLAHGDGKAFNDTGYLILRSVLRNRLAQTLFRLIHPDVGIWLASRTSHGSRDYTSARDLGQEDGLRAFAEDALAEGYNVVVMGHRHMVQYVESKNGVYVNLGHWLCAEPTFGLFDPATGSMQVGQVRRWLRDGNMVLD